MPHGHQSGQQRRGGHRVAARRRAARAPPRSPPPPGRCRRWRRPRQPAGRAGRCAASSPARRHRTARCRRSSASRWADRAGPVRRGGRRVRGLVVLPRCLVVGRPVGVTAQLRAVPRHVRDPGVQGAAGGQRCVRLDGVADQGVPEAEPPRRLLQHEVAVDQLVEAGGRVLVWGVRDLGEQVEVEAPAYDGRGDRAVPGRRRQGLEALLDRLGQGLRHVVRGRGQVTLGGRGDQLLDVQRHPAGALVHELDQARDVRRPPSRARTICSDWSRSRGRAGARRRASGAASGPARPGPGRPGGARRCAACRPRERQGGQLPARCATISRLSSSLQCRSSSASSVGPSSASDGKRGHRVQDHSRRRRCASPEGGDGRSRP